VKLGDKITLILNLNNVKQLMSGEFEIPYWKLNYKFIEVKPNAALSKYAALNGLKVNLSKPTFIEENWENVVKVGASLEGKDFKGLNGDTPFLDVTFEVKNDEFYQEVGSFMSTQFSYKKSEVSEAIALPIFQDKSFIFIPKRSVALGYIRPEAFMLPEGYLPYKDYKKMGAKVYAVTGNGKKYYESIEDNGWFEIHDIPVSAKNYDIYVEMPGHLKSKLTEKLYKNKNGELVGIYHNVYMDESLAGDLNDDSMLI
jgi:hypothetical protein